MTLAPRASKISIRQTLDILDDPFRSVAMGVAEDRYAFWLGSGISFGKVDGLRKIIPRVLDCLQPSRCSPAQPASGQPRTVPARRSQFLGWRITCPLCGDLLRHTGRHGPPLSATVKTPHFGENGSSTMKPSAASEPGYRRPK